MATLLSGVVRLVGEGFERPQGDSEEPLDVRYDKVVDWMVDRRKLAVGWSRQLRALQSRVSQLAQEEGPLRAAVAADSHAGGSEEAEAGAADGGYPEAVRRRDAARVSAAPRRGGQLLGSLRGGSSSGWDSIVREYESSWLHAAEAAQTLARDLDGEAPFLRKTQARSRAAVAEQARRAEESRRAAAVASQGLGESCEAEGVSLALLSAGPGRLEAALRARAAAALPELASVALLAVRSVDVRAAAVLYGVVAGDGPATESGAGARPLASLLAALVEREDEGAALVRAPEGGADEPGSSPGLDSSALDFSDEEAAVLIGDDPAGGGEVSAPGVVLDWGIDLGMSGEEVDEGDRGVAPADADAPSLDWDVVVHEGEAGASEGVQVSLDDGGDGGGNGSNNGGGEDPGAPLGPAYAQAAAREFAEDPVVRAAVVTDLLELVAFLDRLCEEKAAGAGLTSAALAAERGGTGAGGASSGAAEPATSLLDDPAALERSREAALGAAALLEDPQLRRLSAVAAGGRALAREAARLREPAARAAKWEAVAEEAGRRSREAQRQLVDAEAELAIVERRARGMRALLQETLTAKLGRPVRISGGGR